MKRFKIFKVKNQKLRLISGGITQDDLNLIKEETKKAKEFLDQENWSALGHPSKFRRIDYHSLYQDFGIDELVILEELNLFD